MEHALAFLSFLLPSTKSESMPIGFLGSNSLNNISYFYFFIQLFYESRQGDIEPMPI